MKAIKYLVVAPLVIFMFVKTGSAQAPDAARIAFSGGGNIWLIDPDGRNLVNLTQSFGNFEPDWSPDGRYIYFVSARGGNSEIYRMDADGRNPIRLTHHPNDDYHPSVSPDGKQLAFDRNHRGVYIMNADGGDIRQLTDFGARPDWSPDGRRIAFEGRENRKDIYVIGIDGQNLTNLTQDGLGNYAPAWSLDGRQIAYGSWRDEEAGNFEEIYVMDADGENKKRLTRALGIDSFPAWSPGGKQIAFTTQRNPDVTGDVIFLMNANGTRQRALLPLGMNGVKASWFDPAFALAVESIGKLPMLWGRLKQIAEGNSAR
jgi:TolB protein